MGHSEKAKEMTEITYPLLPGAVYSFLLYVVLGMFLAGVLRDIIAFVSAAARCRSFRDIRAAMVAAAINKGAAK